MNTKDRIRKNTWLTQQDVENVQKIAEVKFGSQARWSQAISYFLGKYLGSELQEIAAQENERVRQNTLALQIQADRRRAQELGEVYSDNLNALMA